MTVLKLNPTEFAPGDLCRCVALRDAYPEDSTPSLLLVTRVTKKNIFVLWQDKHRGKFTREEAAAELVVVRPAIRDAEGNLRPRVRLPSGKVGIHCVPDGDWIAACRAARPDVGKFPHADPDTFKDMTMLQTTRELLCSACVRAVCPERAPS